MRLTPFLVLAAAACASGSGGGTASQAAEPSASAGTGGSLELKPMVASLLATNNGGNRIMGSVKLTPISNGVYRAEVQIRNGGGPQNKFPWVIRSGTCGETSSVVLGGELAYKVLETAGDGSAHINSPLRVRIPPGTYHVDVLSGTSSSERELVVSCGVLSTS